MRHTVPVSGNASSDSVISLALARLEDIDPAAALDARNALDWLVGDASLEALCRFGLQQFCWYELPFKWIVAPSVRIEIVRALARFFDLAGLPRYADVCRGELTISVLLAWTKNATEGYRAFDAAMKASGLEPPNLPELTWSDAMEPDEDAAFWSTAMALEIAIDAGELDPSARGWRRRQLEIARAHLTTPREERLGESLLQGVMTERLAGWIEGGWGQGPPSEARRQMLRPITNALVAPMDVPRGVARPLAPVTWLLRAIDGDGSGIVLTQQQRLPRAVVQAAAEAFPRWPSGDRIPQREGDLPELETLHQLVRSMRMVRRSGRRLTLTSRGREAADDVGSLWRAVASTLTERRDFHAAATELVLGGLLVEPMADADVLEAEVLVVLTECGWHHGANGEPVPHDVMRAVMRDIERTLLVLGAVRAKGAQWDRRQWRLTDAGRALALAALRARATAPRRA
jgi:hypothetical protein